MARRKLPSSVCEHELWPQLAPYVVIEKPRKRGETHKPSARIELDRWTPDALRLAALGMRVGCARCGMAISPFRKRTKGTGRADIRHVYCAVACAFPRLGCARSGLASSAVARIERAVIDCKNRQQLELGFK